MNNLHRWLVVVASAAFFVVGTPAFAQWQTPNYSVPIGRGAGTGFKSASPGTSGQALVSNGASADPSFQAITGGAFGTQSANTVFSGPTSGAAASPAFRALVGADLPNPSASTLGGTQSVTCSASQWVNSISTSGVPACAQPGYSDLSGTISTAIDALTGCNVQGGLLYRNGSLWVCLAPGSSGQVLQSGGPAANPSWLTVSGTGTVTSVSAGTGMSFTAITGSGAVAIDKASASDIRAATSNKTLTADGVFNSAGGFVALSGTTTVTPDFSTGFNFTFTATSATNYTLANPTNTKDGQQGCIYLTQPASGTVVTITFGANWSTAGGVSGKALTATLGATDRLCYLVVSSSLIDFTLANNIAH